METKQTIELYKSTQKFLDDLNGSILSRVYEAIDKAEKELGVSSRHFDGIFNYIRAPFGFKPRGVDVAEKIMDSLRFEGETVKFYESVISGPGHRYEYPTTEIRTIAKYL